MKNNKIIGYTAGVFDMFHIGHLNILKKAKEGCDYLIVGVNSDEATYGYKNKRPVIPLNERMAIVKSIRYVDEVVRVDNVDKIFAYEKFKFDLIFVGDDHKTEQKWQDIDCTLRRFGSKVVFMPYTQHISSTKLRDIISTLPQD